MRLLPLICGLAALLSAPPAAATPDAAMEAVLTVQAAAGNEAILGSAFLWGDGAVAVTAAHVVGGAAAVRLTDAAGRVQVARVIARDPQRDVAVLAVVPGRAGLWPGAAPVPGQAVRALGAPLGMGFTMTAGIISAPARQVEPAVPLRLVQHDAAVNPGSSGGPLVDLTGRLAGMNVRIADGSRHHVGIGFAIAAADLARIVSALRAGQLAPVPTLGLRLRAVTGGVAAALGRAPGGVLVDMADPGGRGAVAGLRAGDLILRAGSTALRAPGDLAFAVDAARAGPLLLQGWRGTVPLRVTLDLGVAAPVALAQALPLPTGLTRAGDRIVALAPGGLAARAGLAAGDRVLAVNGTPDLAALDQPVLAGPLLLRLERGAETLHLLLDPAAPASGLRPLGGANVLDPAVSLF